MSVMKCDTHHIHIRSSVTTGKSLHQHETGSWSSWENTETLIREEFAWIPFIAAAANYCSMSSQKSDQFNFYSGLLTTRTTYELWDMNLLFIFWTAGIHSDKTINIKKKPLMKLPSAKVSWQNEARAGTSDYRHRKRPTWVSLRCYANVLFAVSCSWQHRER